MIDKFLKAKHWQLFILIIGVPVVFQIYLMTTLVLNVNLETGPDPMEVFKVMKFFPVMMLIYVIVFFGWFWSIAIGLQKKVPENIKMKTKKFKIFFFIPLVYISIISLFVGVLFSAFFQNGSEPDPAILAGVMAILIPIHIASMVGMFYCMYFVAKTIKTVELQKEVKFGDFAGEFFLIWFYFIGIWFIQPRINKIANGFENHVNTIE